MSSIIVKQDQSIFDMSLQLYGSIEYVFKIVQDNPGLLNIHPQNITGFNIQYDEQLTDNVVFFKTNKINITTGAPRLDLGESFDDSFDDSFN
jgi:hypothetical protein